MRGKWGIIVLCLWLTWTGSAQVAFEPVHFNITTEHGLPSLETYGVKQDSKGYIWICTDAGVCRYDGYTFKTFTTKDGLTDNVVFDIYEDFRGRIWFLTRNSMLCYFDQGRIVQYRYNKKLQAAIGDWIGSSNQKTLNVASDGSIQYSIVPYGLVEVKKDGSVVPLVHTKKGEIGLKKVKGIKMYYALKGAETSEERFIPVQLKNGKSGRFFNPSLWNAYPPADANLTDDYTLIDGVVFRFSDGKVVHEGYQLTEFQIRDSVFFITGIQGLFIARLGPDDRLVQEAHFFDGIPITNICFDRQGGVWLTTLDRGVLYYRDKPVLKQKEAHLGEITRNVVSLAEWNNDVYFSSYTAVKSIKGDEITACANIGNIQSLFSNGEDLFIGLTYSGDAPLKLEEHIYQTDAFSDIKRYGGKLYCANRHEIVERSYVDGREVVKLIVRNNDKTVQHNFLALLKLGDCLLVGSDSGLYEFVNNEKRLLQVREGKQPSVRRLEYWEGVGIVIGTNDEGVLILRSDGQLDQVYQINNMAGNKVTCLKVCKDGVLVGTSSGLVLLSSESPGKYHAENLSSSLLYEVGGVNAIEIIGDWIYFGTKKGLFKVGRNSILNSETKFPVHVETTRVEVDSRLLTFDGTITIPHDANLLKVEFAVLQFDTWLNKNYQYRIGSNGEWIDLASPSITLYRPSGEFDLEIRYMDANFQWSEPVKLCHVRVLVPFWQKWYFWLLLVLVFFCGIFLLYRRRQLQINARLVQENQVLMLEQQMQNARMNPHFIFNVLNSIHSFVIHEERDQAELYLMKFSRLMREILTQTRDGDSTIGEECSLLEKYLELEQLRHRDSFEYLVRAPLELKKRVIPSMLIQPFAENAVLHGLKGRKGGVLRITFSKESEQEVEVTISDNGRMSDEQFEKLQQSGDKNAFGITKLRLEKYNRLKQTKNYGITILRSEEGTVIRITIPILEDQHEK